MRSLLPIQDQDTFSGTNPLKLSIDSRIADIQSVKNFVANNGHLQLPIEGADQMNWAAAPKLNGIYLQNYLSKFDFKVELIHSYYEQRNTFQTLLEKSPKAVLISTTFIVDKQTLAKLAADIRNLAPGYSDYCRRPFQFASSYNIIERACGKGVLAGSR